MRKLVLAFVLLLVAGGAQAATLFVNGLGGLTGVTGVDVGGTLYDVEFVDGTCIDLFSGCDEPDDFTFKTGESATLATQTLLAALAAASTPQVVPESSTALLLGFGPTDLSWAARRSRHA